MFLLFAGPNLLLFGVFTFWPIAYTAWVSLLEWNLLPGQGRFVGLANYAAILCDPTCWRVALNTLVYAFCVVGFAQSAAFLLALLLNRPLPGRAVFRTLAFMPYVTTPAAAGLAFVLLLDPRFGPLSRLYQITGAAGPHWLESGMLALGAIILVGIWKEIGFAAVFFLAGLQGLPQDCYEAARIDGAPRRSTLWHITFPLMTPVIFFLLVSGFIAALKTFDTVAIMTEGGPVYPDSATYVYHLYRLAFRDFQAGYASAFAMLFFLATLAATAFQFRLARRWVHYA